MARLDEPGDWPKREWQTYGEFNGNNGKHDDLCIFMQHKRWYDRERMRLIFRNVKDTRSRKLMMCLYLSIVLCPTVQVSEVLGASLMIWGWRDDSPSWLDTPLNQWVHHGIMDDEIRVMVSWLKCVSLISWSLVSGCPRHCKGLDFGYVLNNYSHMEVS